MLGGSFGLRTVIQPDKASVGGPPYRPFDLGRGVRPQCPKTCRNELGLDRAEYGTHSMRRTKATLIHRRTKNLRAVQLLLGHSKLESTVRYLGIEVDDALEISEQTEI